MIYWPFPLDGYEGTLFVDYDYGDQFLIDNQGTSLAHGWRPMRVRLFTTKRDWRPADFPWLASDALVLRPRALEVMEDLLLDHGEILPLVPYRGTELFLFNSTRLLDALDTERSSLSRFDDGTIWFIDAPCFHEPVVRDVDLFKVPDVRASEIVVSQRFVDRVQQAGLTGMGFHAAWSAEGGPVQYKLFDPDQPAS